MKTMPNNDCTFLPDGSAFMVGSLPLPKNHWLYAPQCLTWDSVRETSTDTPEPILSLEQRDAVITAIRWAIRGATMNGADMDFDPDALVKNAAYALCGPLPNRVSIRWAVIHELSADTDDLPTKESP